MNHPRLFFALAGPLILFGAGCAQRDEGLLVDRTGASGVQFVHVNGMSDQLWFAEMMGGGVALFDMDRDGDQDLFFTQGQAFDGPAQQGVLHSVWRNDSTPGQLAFVDVSATARVASSGYAMGVAVGDVNNDGWPDLYVTEFGDNALWLNRQDGTFERVEAAQDARWSVSAAFADLNADGSLDLYVGNYVDYRLANHKPCRSTTSARDYCSPTVYPPQADSVWYNDGRGGFADVTAAVGVGAALGGALGVIVADLDGDQHADVYVANDGTANLLWHNQGDGRFTNTAAVAGAAVNMGGAPEASMGIDAADFDGDGDIDLFMTHLNRESNTLYENDGAGYFDDRSATSGVGSDSMAFTGFGTRWIDLDADGDLDIFAANGAVTRVQALIDAGNPYPLGQRNQVFLLGPEGYRESVEAVAPHAHVSRGLAVGDLDNDGAIDLVVANNNGPAQVLHNRAAPARWIGLDVRTALDGRSAIGATVTLSDATAQRVRRVRRDGSYASSSDPRVVFAAVAPEFSLEVRWPDGTSRVLDDLASNRYHLIAPDEAR